MKKIRAYIRLLFGFSQTETNAFLILLPLMLIVITAEPFYQTYFLSGNPDNLLQVHRFDSVLAKLPEPAAKKSKRTFSKPAKRTFTRTKTKIQQENFDLNLADTTQLKSVYGIGSVRAKRIVAYRNSLGGFVEMTQLYEIWGLDSAVVARLAGRSAIAPGFTPARLSINRSSEEELGRHPYLRTKLARAIVNYRFQHGNFAAIEDLRKISLIDEKAFLRIKPYTILE